MLSPERLNKRPAEKGWGGVGSRKEALAIQVQIMRTGKVFFTCAGSTVWREHECGAASLISREGGQTQNQAGGIGEKCGFTQPQLSVRFVEQSD